MKDHRLDLGRYVRNPFNRRGQIPKRLDFQELFTSKASTGDYPWNPSRFNESDLLKKAQTKKVTLNPDLNFVGESAFFDESKGLASSEYEMFEGIGRFNRRGDVGVGYSFEEGRPLTKQRPQDQPDYNPLWIDAYKISPTVKPGKRAKNPMPRMSNPDPNGYIMARAQRMADDDVRGVASVADLLKGNKSPAPQLKNPEEKTNNEATNKTTEENNTQDQQA